VKGGFIEDSPILSWAANNARLNPGGKGENWTLFSTSKYGRENKAPQEAVPAAVSKQVTQDMLNELARVLRRPLPSPVFSRCESVAAVRVVGAPVCCGMSVHCVL
jgi:hypothetical protein